MRQLCTLPDESTARLFSDYLYILDIKNKIEVAESGEGQNKEWEIWIYDENRLDETKALLGEYLNDPEASKFREAAPVASERRKSEERELKAYRERVFTGQRIFPKYDRIGLVTLILMVISIVVALVSKLGDDHTFTHFLFISEYIGSGLIEVRLGQIWRLVTPIFIHFGILHILFNMLWLRDLGSMIEQRQGGRTLGLLVLMIAAVSNIGQYMMSGPMFGGMSGVIYGLLGYAWMRGKHDPSSGLFVHPQTLTMMIIWFVVCLTGLIGHVANTAHGAGLAAGICWGFISAKRADR